MDDVAELTSAEGEGVLNSEPVLTGGRPKPWLRGLRRRLRPSHLLGELRLRRSGKEWAADIGCTFAALLLGSLLIWSSLEEDTGDVSLRAEAISGPVVLALVLLCRRRWPLGLGIAMIVLQFASTLALGGVAVATFSMAIYRSWRVTLSYAVVYFGFIVVMFHFVANSRQSYWEGVAFIGLLLGILVTSGMLIRSQRLLVESLRERARQAEEGQRLRVEEARRLERERIAREMHDVLAHRISLLAVHSGALEYRPELPPDEIRRSVGVIRESAYEALEDLRDVIGVLRDDSDSPDTERPQPALSDLPRLIKEARQAGASITLDDQIAELESVPSGIGRHAYRIVQEGLTNARKHAPGAAVRVTLVGSPGDELTVELRNSMSSGREAAIPGAGAGLIGLGERVDLAGGRLEHGRVAGGDFRLWVSLPWPT